MDNNNFIEYGVSLKKIGEGLVQSSIYSVIHIGEDLDIMIDKLERQVTSHETNAVRLESIAPCDC
ncbi:hypothetical protein [Robertmurraya sp. FSL R5-0851]|uniref:hypothetical protein n=1 Tax=Robertmurraya sp. FSL R5-0851 TaxID=2921584 RepID=UPI0030F93E53